MHFPSLALPFITAILALTPSTVSATATTLTVQVAPPPASTAKPPPSATPADAVSKCGSAPYHKSQYTCFNNQSLCPIQGGIAYQLCVGDGGCYDAAKYKCVNGHLGPK